MTGVPLIIAFVIAIVVMILMISKFKIHPFISIMLVALVLGLVAGIPLVDGTTADGTSVNGIVTVIVSGFSGVFTGSCIGLVIIFGTIVGAVLEATGGALKLADMIVKLVGKKHPEVAMALMGWVVSVPVFCDSGFVILNPIRKAMVQRTAASSVMLTVALSCGLYISHVFMPPTPGPIAAAGTLMEEGLGMESADLLLVMGIGVFASILPLIAGIIFARFIGKKINAEDENESKEVTEEAYNQLVATYGKLPGGFNTLAPIVVPVVFMALGTISSMAGWTGVVDDICTFLGKPVIALACGVVCCVIQLGTTGKLDKFHDLVQDALKTVGPIIFITAAGSVLGKVIASTDLVNFIKENADVMEGLGILFPFLLAAILKTAQGSSTVAITTTAGILAPLMVSLGFDTPVAAALLVMAIGAGAMTVSHANDSYFWVVTNFGAMQPEQGYKTQTVLTGIMGVASIIDVWIVYMVCQAMGLC